LWLKPQLRYYIYTLDKSKQYNIIILQIDLQSWQIPSKRKPNFKPNFKNLLEIPTSNRFSIFQVDPVFDNRNSNKPEGKLPIKGKVEVKKVKIYNKKSSLDKNCILKNKFSVFQYKSEKEINAILSGEDLLETRSNKIKCRHCGYKKNCRKENNCQA
jgi:hypothetical protein